MITLDDVKDRLGIPRSDPHDDVLIRDCIDAAYAYLASVRPEVDWTTPTPSQKLGMVWLIARYYQEQGRSDSTVDSIEQAVPLVGRQANQLLGLGYYFGPVVS